MNLETKKVNEVVIVKPLSENLNAVECTDFKGKIIDLINGGNHFVLLNLSQVKFIDSSGLGAIISILKILELKNRGTIVLCEIKDPVLNLFKLTRMDRVFKICSSEQTGLATISDVKKAACIQNR